MNKKQKTGLIAGAVIVGTTIVAKIVAKKANKTTYKVNDERLSKLPKRREGFYEKHIKRVLDVACSTAALTIASPLYVGLALLVRKNLGSPVIFTQERPGLVDPETGKETIFKLYKFRTMTDEKDSEGNLLPDDKRLTKFGAWLRSTSLDELPEAFNILNGTMSVIGPRPQLVRDLVFMTDEERMRHSVKPGLSGLAQVNGRNAISWEDKFKWDRKYIEHIGLFEDVKIVLETVGKAFIKQEGITEEGQATAEDFGDYLLKKGKVDQESYDQKQVEAKEILMSEKSSTLDEEIKNAPSPTTPYSVLMSLYIKEKPEYLDLAIQSMVEQTYKPDEIVIVKDGEITPELQAVLDKYDDACPGLFNIVGYEKNRGLGLALNFGLEHCKNELVARMDTDDIAKPDRCEKQVKAFELHLDYSIIGSAVDEFYGDPSNITSCRVVPTTPDEIYNFAKKRSAFNHPSVMYRKSEVLRFNGYSDLRRNQDVDLFGRMLFGGCKAANFQESLLWFRSDENLSKRRKSWENTWSYIDTIKRFWKMGYSSFGDYAMIAVAQTGMYLMPIGMQNWLYRKFLRK